MFFLDPKSYNCPDPVPGSYNVAYPDPKSHNCPNPDLESYGVAYPDPNGYNCPDPDLCSYTVLRIRIRIEDPIPAINDMADPDLESYDFSGDKMFRVRTRFSLQILFLVLG